MRTIERDEPGSLAPPRPLGIVVGPRIAGQRCCAHHPGAAPTLGCTRCGDLLCGACAPTREVNGVELEICPCSGLCVPLTDREAGLPPEPFSSQLASAFGYPFAGAGAYVLASGAVCLGILALLLSDSLARPVSAILFGALAAFFGLLALGYLAEHLFDIVASTSTGREELPDWPDFLDPWGSALKPLGKLAAILSVCFGPVVLWTTLLGTEGWLVWILLAAGLVYFPMALICHTVRGGAAAMSPELVLGSIARIPRHYLAACGTISVLLFLLGFLRLLTFLPLIGSFVSAAALLYILMVVMRIIGLTYRSHRHELELG